MRHLAWLFLLACACVWVGMRPAPSAAHAYHVSLTQVAYNAETKALEIAVKIFTDDLEGTLEALGAPRLHLDGPLEHADAKALIARYLENRISWTVNGSVQSAKFIGREYEDDATWCYLEITDLPEFRSFTVRNVILTERFEDQSNLIHLTVNGRTQSLLLNAQKPTGSMNF